MVRQVRFLVTVEEVSDSGRAKRSPAEDDASSPSEGDAAPAGRRSKGSGSQEKS